MALIETDLALLDAQISMIYVAEHRRPRRRWSGAEVRWTEAPVTPVAADLAAAPDR